MQVSENRRTNSGLETETPEEADWDRSRSLGRTTRRYYRAVGIRTEYRKVSEKDGHHRGWWRGCQRIREEQPGGARRIGRTTRPGDREGKKPEARIKPGRKDKVSQRKAGLERR